MVTLTQLAKIIGVSPGVVSRVVNEDETLRISAKTREKVLEAVKAHNYAPNAAARSLRSSTSGVLAVVVHDVSNPVYTEILRGSQAAARNSGKALILADSENGKESMANLTKLINGGGLDGLIIQGSGQDADNMIARAAMRKMPTVSLQTRLKENAFLLSLPDREAGKIAAQHLYDLGHRTIGCLATNESLTFTKERLQGVQAVFPDLERDQIVYCESTAAAGEEGVDHLLNLNKKMTAILSFNALAAVGALRSARRNGIEIPQDLSLVSVHDLAFAGDLFVPLTTVRMPLSELGAAAVERVLSHELDPASRHQIATKPQLVLRSSTGAI